MSEERQRYFEPRLPSSHAQRGPSANAPAALEGEAAVDAASPGGRPLPGALLSYFEPRLGRGLGDVRVHTGSTADASARAHHAEAYTYGKHIVFRSGRYTPGTPDGFHLLAHELAHAAQHSGSGRLHPFPDKAAVSHPGDAAEAEAERAAAQLVAGRTASVRPFQGPPTIHRAIPNPEYERWKATLPKIGEYRTHIDALRKRFAEPGYETIREEVMKALDVADKVLDRYAGARPAAPAVPGAVGLANMPPPVVIPGVTPPPVVAPTPAPPPGVTGTPSGMTGGTLGIGAVIGLAVIGLTIGLRLLTKTSVPDFSEVESMMTELDTQIEAALQKLPKAKPAIEQCTVDPKPAASPEAGTKTVTKTDDKEERCPAGQVPYSQAAAVARVVELMQQAPHRLGMAGKATSMSSAKFLASILTNVAVVSVVSPKECTLASAEGIHDKGDEDHAEAAALAKLKPWRDSTKVLPPGTRLSVVVSANPCGADRKDCWGKLMNFAARTPILAYNPAMAKYLLTVQGIRPRED